METTPPHFGNVFFFVFFFLVCDAMPGSRLYSHWSNICTRIHTFSYIDIINAHSIQGKAEIVSLIYDGYMVCKNKASVFVYIRFVVRYILFFICLAAVLIKFSRFNGLWVTKSHCTCLPLVVFVFFSVGARNTLPIGTTALADLLLIRSSSLLRHRKLQTKARVRQRTKIAEEA